MAKLKKEMHCLECGKVFNNMKTLTAHIVLAHLTSIKDYYDKYLKQEGEGKCRYCGKETEFTGAMAEGYRKYCCKSCATNWQLRNSENCECTCLACKQVFKSTSQNMLNLQFGNHLKNVHKYEPKTYYDLYIKKPGEGICPECGKETTFLKISRGYNECCSQECRLKHIQKIQREDHKELQEYRAEQAAKIKTQEELDRDWQEEIKARLAEFEGDKDTVLIREYWADSTPIEKTETHVEKKSFLSRWLPFF